MLYCTWHSERLSRILCGQRHRRYIRFIQVSDLLRYIIICVPFPKTQHRSFDSDSNSIFRCLQFMSDFNSCLLQNFGVLAGPPSRVKALLVATTYAIISWQPPKVLPDTVTEYHIYLRKLGSGTEYNVVEKDHQPIILENLEPATRYEVFIVSMNAHGKGGPSPRLVLQTMHEVREHTHNIYA